MTVIDLKVLNKKQSTFQTAVAKSEILDLILCFRDLVD